MIGRRNSVAAVAASAPNEGAAGLIVIGSVRYCMRCLVLWITRFSAFWVQGQCREPDKLGPEYGIVGRATPVGNDQDDSFQDFRRFPLREVSRNFGQLPKVVAR